jgi:uncharacterized protein (TIGR02147 family)
MKKSIFDFQDYKAYLSAFIDSQPNQGHGYRSKIAEAVGCQRAYLSQVLHGKAQLSLEQAERLNSFLGHNEDEGFFFLLLVEYARAGTEPLKRALRRQLEKAIESRMLVKNRIANEREMNAEEKQRYYSAWYYGAARVASGIKGLGSREALAKRLGIGVEKMGEVLDFLVSVGLMKEEGSTYEPTSHMSILNNDSALIAKHHTNWRVRAIQALDSEGPRDLHYSSVITLSAEDAFALRALAVDFIETVMKKVRESPEETVCSFCLDFYEI